MDATADHDYMARALRLARRGLYTTDPNPRVGCVLVRDGNIVGEGWHQRAGSPHAEIEALRMAGESARGADCYVSLEPCCHHGRTPPCTDALKEAGVRRVVVAMSDPNPRVAGKGLKQLREAGIETRCGLLAAEAEKLNRGFCKRMRKGMPWVTVKMAASLDGRTALASGESRWITSAEARRDVHRWRARSSAIMTGIDTVLADDPALTARLEGVDEVLQPLRVVLDSRLRMPPSAKMLALPGETVVVTVTEDSATQHRLEDAGARVWVVGEVAGRVDLGEVWSRLAAREINEVMVEAGPRLNGAVVQGRWLDEGLLYLAPCLLGADARGLFHLPGVETMGQRIEVQFGEIRRIGADLRIRFRLREG